MVGRHPGTQLYESLSFGRVLCVSQQQRRQQHVGFLDGLTMILGRVLDKYHCNTNNNQTTSNTSIMMNSRSVAPPLMNHSEGAVILGGQENADGAVKQPMDFPGREQPYEHRFSPYDMNGGTVAGVSGEDYLVIAADTRMSTGYEILSRNTSKLHQLNPNAILASSGCKTDMDQLRSVLDIKMKVRWIIV